MSKFKEGAKAIIVANTSSHYFDMGTVVTLLKEEGKESNRSWRCYDEHTSWWVKQEDMQLCTDEKSKESDPKFKLGDVVQIVNNDSFHGFKIGSRVTLIERSEDNSWKCEKDEEGWWYVAEDEMKPIEEEKPIKQESEPQFVYVVTSAPNSEYDNFFRTFSSQQIAILSAVDYLKTTGERPKIYKSIVDSKKDYEEIFLSSEVLAEELVGDGGNPNLWFVTTSPRYTKNGNDAVCEGFEESERVVRGPFKSYSAADYYFELVNLDVHTGVGEVIIEDRKNGTVKTKFLDGQVTYEYKETIIDDSRAFYSKKCDLKDILDKK
jgi:hypothetical protein